jgi:ATP-dependent protease ClpP protease subunit
MRPSNIRCQQSEQGVELAILGEITSYTAQDIISALAFFKDQPVIITMMSGGGDAFASLGLYDYMRDKDVTVRVYGIAASGAAIISAGARRTEMAAGAFLMIHNAYSVVEGQGEDVLASINERQVDIFSARTGMRKDKVKKMLEAETFLTAQQAKDMGFADAVFDPLKVAASLDKMQPMEDIMKATPEVVEATPADVVVETPVEEPQPEAEAEAVEAETEEVIELEVPVSITEAVQAAVRGHVKAKVNIAAKYGEVVAALTDEVRALRAQLDEANAAVEAAEAKAVDSEADAAKVIEAEAKAAEAARQVEALKATPLEQPVVSDAQPTAVVPGAPVRPGMNPATAHAERMAQTLERLDRKIGINKN